MSSSRQNSTDRIGSLLSSHALPSINENHPLSPAPVSELLITISSPQEITIPVLTTDPYWIDPTTIKDEENSSNLIGTTLNSKIYRHTWRGKTIAVKQVLLQQRDMDTCNNEKNILIKLTEAHATNIIQFYGFFITSKLFYFAIEHMSKGALSYYIDNVEPFAWPIRFKMMLNITEAVAVMHENDIIHADIKSPNILLNDVLEAKLNDFGLSVTTDANQFSGGTPEWMAPELFNCEYNSKEADIYALAVTYYEIVSWKCPYSHLGKYDISTLLTYVKEGNRSPIPETTPKKIAELIGLGWAADKSLRPSAEKLLSELRSIDVDALTDEISTLKM